MMTLFALVAGLALWTAFCLAAAYASWLKISGHIKVYMLILYNLIFLMGAFMLFPLLKRIQ